VIVIYAAVRFFMKRDNWRKSPSLTVSAVSRALENTTVCTRRRAPFRSRLKKCRVQPRLARNQFQVRNSVRPIHLFGRVRDHDFYFKLPVKRSGTLNHYVGDLLHTMAMSRLSRVRTETFQLLIIPSPAPHPVHADRQPPRHGDLGDLSPSSHGQMEKLVAPFRLATYRNLRCF
jgi:hypothetical protein